MKRTFSMLGLILLLLAGLDIAVAGVLLVAQERGKLGSFVRYFDYGRSVPGKLDQWEAEPDAQGNLYDIGWRSEIVAASVQAFAQGQDVGRPVVRSYGMSFVNHIMEKAQQIDPTLSVDAHSGPSAPPNYTYALALDDTANRKPGDVAVLGILSSAVPAMAALSNRTWLFEQPAPFTYPIFQLQEGGLRRIDPLITSSIQERALDQNAEQHTVWMQQLEDEDLFYAPTTFDAKMLDASPFARLVRRSLAKSHITQVEQGILAGDYPYPQVLRQMMVEFAQHVRDTDQTPIVVLVQTQDSTDVDLLALLKPILDQEGITYLATAEHFDHRDPSGFLVDGHYRDTVNESFAQAFVDLMAQANADL